MKKFNRRHFLRQSAVLTGSLALADSKNMIAFARADDPLFRISLAEWSFNRMLFAGELDNLDFPATARRLGIEGVEYVNQFFMDKAKDMAYLRDLKSRAEGEGITNVLIMCDSEGSLGDPNPEERTKTVENHYKWIEAAKFLGCHSIRVNAYSSGSFDEQMKLVADGLSRLGAFGADQNINVIIENHGGFSSNGQWLVGLMKMVDQPHVGTLPDFGNFRISQGEEYDRYQGVEELMPYAKGVSAKSRINEKGEEADTDYTRIMKIVLDAGYRGFVGIESGGMEGVSEEEAVVATKRILERVREELAPHYQ